VVVAVVVVVVVGQQDASSASLVIHSITTHQHIEGLFTWQYAPVQSSGWSTHPTIWQPGFNLPRQQWSLLNHFQTAQGHCDACKKKWNQATCLNYCQQTMTLLVGWPAIALDAYARTTEKRTIGSQLHTKMVLERSTNWSKLVWFKTVNYRVCRLYSNELFSYWRWKHTWTGAMKKLMGQVTYSPVWKHVLSLPVNTRLSKGIFYFTSYVLICATENTLIRYIKVRF